MTGLSSIKISDPSSEEVPASLALEKELGTDLIKLNMYKSYDPFILFLDASSKERPAHTVGLLEDIIQLSNRQSLECSPEGIHALVKSTNLDVCVYGVGGG